MVFPVMEHHATGVELEGPRKSILGERYAVMTEDGIGDVRWK